MSTSAKPKTPAQLKPTEDIDATYMKENQCVCGFQAADGHALCVHMKNQHPHGYYRCWGLLKSSTTGQERHCPYETDDQGVMWRYYRMKHLGLYYRQCSVDKCTGGKDGGCFMSDNLDAIAKHMSTYHGAEASLTCPHCKKYVASAKYMLERHMQACSTKDKKVKFHHCEVCGKGFCDWTPSPTTNCECTQKYLIAQLDGTSAVSVIKSLQPPVHVLTILGKFTLLSVKRVVRRKELIIYKHLSSL